MAERGHLFASPAPVRPTTVIRCRRAALIACEMFSERPEVEITISTSGSAEPADLPLENLLMAVIVGDLQSRPSCLSSTQSPQATRGRS
jgi:hypothetical protein